ncbi:MAG: DoxX family protein [Bacteroidales bacterium]|nr:DoxX family protein [Bacteroidales bacterium]
MNTLLMVIQVILALVFSSAGLVKISMPAYKLVRMGTWTERFPVSVVRFIGGMELLGAAGLIFSRAFSIFPLIMPMASCGLSLIMILATYHHINHREYRAIILTLVLMMLSAYSALSGFRSL